MSDSGETLTGSVSVSNGQKPRVRNIAIAGGTSPTLGRAIITALISLPKPEPNTSSSMIQPIILSRVKPSTSGSSSDQPPTLAFQPKNTPNATPVSIPIRYVDYTTPDSPSLVSALRDVETLITVLKIPGPAWVDVQLNLLRAAEEAGVQRFAPSEWELGPLTAGRVDATSGKSVVWQECLAAKSWGKVKEVARFMCGGWMNYLALADRVGPQGVDGQGATERKEAMRHGVDDEVFVWDVKNRKADVLVKRDGTVPRVTLTELSDVGRFVARACQMELKADGGKGWEEDMCMVGETIEVDRVVDLLERKFGSKFEVTKLDENELRKRADSIEGVGRTRDEVVRKLEAQMGLVILEEKVGGAILEPVLNKLFPDIEVCGVEEFLDRAYG